MYTEEIEATGHTPGAEATCTEDQVCIACDEILAKATGHDEVIDPAVEATCTTTGLTQGSHCSVCKAVIKAQIEVAEKGHTAGTAQEENRVEATCTEAGS